jgi:hypothetical protein
MATTDTAQFVRGPSEPRSDVGEPAATDADRMS